MNARLREKRVFLCQKVFVFKHLKWKKRLNWLSAPTFASRCSVSCWWDSEFQIFALWKRLRTSAREQSGVRSNFQSTVIASLIKLLDPYTGRKTGHAEHHQNCFRWNARKKWWDACLWHAVNRLHGILQLFVFFHFEAVCIVCCISFRQICTANRWQTIKAILLSLRSVTEIEPAWRYLWARRMCAYSPELHGSALWTACYSTQKNDSKLIQNDSQIAWNANDSKKWNY